MSRNIFRYAFFSFLWLLFNNNTFAQERFLAEVGVFGGGTFYLGDAQSVPFQQIKETYGGFLKYKLDKRYSFGIQSCAGRVSIPKFEQQAAWTNSFWDIEAIAEFNFFDFGFDRIRSTTKRTTPYIFAGVGCTVYNHNAAFMIPFGIGGKFKLNKRINMGITWSIKKLFKDDFDNINNPRGLNKNVIINNDWYSTLTVQFSVEFWEWCRTCHSGLKK